MKPGARDDTKVPWYRRRYWPPCRLLIALLPLAAGASWAQQPAIVELHHRSVESLVTVLPPLVAPAVVTGAGSQLQVRASASDLPRVVRLIEESDRPLRALVVAFSDEPPGGQDVQTAARPPLAGGSITLSTGTAMPPDPVGNGQVLSTRPDRGSTRVIEGEALRLSMPAPQSLWFGVHGGRGGQQKPKAAAAGADNGASAAAAVQGVVHFDGVSDVIARVWVAQATVAIELKPLASGSLDAGADRASEQAIVYGRIGQWIALADSGVDVQAASHGSGAPRGGLWIRVDAAPDSAGTWLDSH